MVHVVKRCISTGLLLLCLGTAAAGNGLDPKQLEHMGEQCRQLALMLEDISQHQSRVVCLRNLDGLNVYFAADYIRANRLEEAKKVINSAIIQTKFAIDIGCHGLTEMQTIVKGLQTIKDSLP